MQEESPDTGLIKPLTRGRTASEGTKSVVMRDRAVTAAIRHSRILATQVGDTILDHVQYRIKQRAQRRIIQ